MIGKPSPFLLAMVATPSKKGIAPTPRTDQRGGRAYRHVRTHGAWWRIMHARVIARIYARIAHMYQRICIKARASNGATGISNGCMQRQRVHPTATGNGDGQR